MDLHTHRRALAAATRLALASCALPGCDKGRSDASPPLEPASPEPRADTPEPEQHANAAAPAPTDPTESAPAPTDTIRACVGLVDEAFPQPGEYPGERKNVGIAVRACCAELMVHGEGMGPHRWDCCANLPEDRPDLDQRIGSACTPWGPPVPPAMPRLARVRTEIA